jgi:glucokinase
MNGPVGALELGGTHVTAARIAGGEVVPGSRVRRPLRPDGDRAELLGAILDAAVAADRPEVGRWGVAVPGPFDYEHGICTIRGVHKLEALCGVDLRAELVRALRREDGGRVRFLNDADAFLLGEWRAGAARGIAAASASPWAPGSARRSWPTDASAPPAPASPRKAASI